MSKNSNLLFKLEVNSERKTDIVGFLNLNNNIAFGTNKYYTDTCFKHRTFRVIVL